MPQQYCAAGRAVGPVPGRDSNTSFRPARRIVSSARIVGRLPVGYAAPMPPVTHPAARIGSPIAATLILLLPALWQSLPAARMGHRRISGALVRRLPRTCPLDYLRPVACGRSAARFLAGHSPAGCRRGLGDRRALAHAPIQSPSVRLAGNRCGARRDDGAAVARQRSPHRHFRRPCRTRLSRAGDLRRSRLSARTRGARSVRRFCGLDPQRHLCGAVGARLAGARLFMAERQARSAPRTRAGIVALVLGAAMLLAGNYIVAKQVAWTPGGYEIAFGRMLQDGIVTRYLNDHCPGTAAQTVPLPQRTAARRRRVSVGHGQQRVRPARPICRARR